jgi:ABC-type multidrug transport system ATPase subunit
LDLSVYKGDIYGFLGPNGSGKSTTIRLMLSLVRPDAGEVKIFGLSLNKYRMNILSRIGALVEKPDFYEYLTARKNMEILMKYSGMDADQKVIEDALDKVGLKSRASSKVKTYSKGMKQRLGIAQALLHDPELLILDEPSSGLDPAGARDIRKLIIDLNRNMGKTIILSSHHLNEIQEVANRMVIIKEGKNMVEGDVETLLSGTKLEKLFFDLT